MKSLYLFVTTDRPDQYLNSIVFCIEKGASKIIFVQIENDQNEQVQLNLLRTNVYNLLQNLATGYYKYYTGLRKDQVVSLNTEYSADEMAILKARYSLCLTDDINWKIERVPYLELRKYISTIKKKQSLILDVTSVSKVYLSDILACSFLENIEELCTFDLLVNPNLVNPNFQTPWNILIHALEKDNKYKYTNLFETPISKESRNSILIKTTPLLASVIGTILFIIIVLVASFTFGFGSLFIQVMSTIGTVLGITSFFLIYFPVRGE